MSALLKTAVQVHIAIKVLCVAKENYPVGKNVMLNHTFMYNVYVNMT